MNKFDISTRMDTVRGFLDDPDTHQAILVITDTPNGQWVRVGDVEAYAKIKVERATKVLMQQHADEISELLGCK
jgi:hypothetical protein